ncbi:glycine cleavage system aminomethyltransferase GcvT [Amylibacter sp. SFDW26]|uniref:glycine cleavage system aminomethyltransferase GcvT n=1 Tax=Amylibacter sp. SFDW26 TaxID=2652722 RepID=UPI001261819F|nr:glycine cleavage system aminomethyltransferase GcvT [Amylibacter sp. SFDW26]KAB7615450.1 glycine cleavage system aminomethyltransferase GcvT [Amylibacter sp. SFDW26]
MADLKQTPLHAMHTDLGAKMVPFAGYDMPVQYPMGVMKEHIHTREHAGLFDVSHMGQVIIRAKSGDVRDAALELERLVPMNIADLGENRQRYAFFTNDKGGILDDLMVANRGDHLFLVVNAACKEDDILHLRAHLLDSCDIEVITDRALIALQGPASEAALSRLSDDVAAMCFMDVATTQIMGAECWVSRSGYTGEDGYEISVPNDKAVEVAAALLAMEEVAPIGLGARDSLRLEAGLCLYGNDIDTTTTPVEADLKWAIQKARRAGGDREGGFIGADAILAQFEKGADHKRVGIKPEGRAPMRQGTVLFADETSANPIGEITSGGFGPSFEGPVSMGYVPVEFSNIGTQVFADVRGKRMPATVHDLPFIPANFKR